MSLYFGVFKPTRKGVGGNLSEAKIMKRCRDAKDLAMAEYADRGYDVTASDNKTFCFLATDKAMTHECKVRVVVDRITPQDIEIITKLRILPNQRKEIMCRPFGKKQWIRRIYDHLNNLCQ